MVYNKVFEPMSEEQFGQKLASLNQIYDLIAVTLTNGDVLLGSVFKHWQWKEESIASQFGWSDNVLPLAFNTPEGKVFGSTDIADIPIDLIADISVIPLDISCGESRIAVQSYPNPLATNIHTHNMSVVTACEFNLTGYGEKALVPDAIPPEGINFTDEHLLYADWDYFLREQRGSWNINVSFSPVPLSVGKDGRVSLREQVFQRLKSSKTSPNDVIVKGCLFSIEPLQEDTIEGDVWRLYRVIETKAGGNDYPVLVKTKGMGLTVDCFGHINSELTFLGTFIPNPVKMVSKQYDKALLARAIGHIKEKLSLRNC